MWQRCKRTTRCKRCDKIMLRGTIRYSQRERFQYWRHEVYYCQTCAIGHCGAVPEGPLFFTTEGEQQMFKDNLNIPPVTARIITCQFCGRDFSEDILSRHINDFHMPNGRRMIRLPK